MLKVEKKTYFDVIHGSMLNVERISRNKDKRVEMLVEDETETNELDTPHTSNNFDLCIAIMTQVCRIYMMGNLLIVFL